MSVQRDGVVRTFVAVWLDERLRRCVEEFARSVRTPVEGAAGSVRWVKASQFHFTLRFLGELDRDARERVFEAVTEACRTAAPFSLRLGGVGGFPDLRRPRVLWVGVEPPGDRLLASLAEAVQQALERRGFGPPDRPFSPHLTIGRLTQPPAGGLPEEWLAARAGEVLGPACGAMEVREVAVMASRLTPAGPVYTPLLAVPLQGCPAQRGSGAQHGVGDRAKEARRP